MAQHSAEPQSHVSSHISDELHVLCRRYQAIALAIDQQTITVALVAPASDELVTALSFASGRKVITEQWPVARFEQMINQATPRQMMQNEETNRSDERIRADDDSDIPVIQFINQTLRSAIQRRASDIHFEPYQHHYRIRLRIDGVLHAIYAPPVELTARLAARLKVMAKLNISERRLPQDGQLSFTLGKHCYPMRIAVLPTQYGEKIVIRIIHTDQQQLALEKLGFTDTDLKQLMQALCCSQGLILVTGPTGSGKTVTLYSGLLKLNHTNINVCSVEDPIEIPVHGINQTQVNNKIELDFSRVLRALLRQDPDVIMIGEIRDAETAEIAVKAAQTGHLVLSTLHTNSTADTLARLAQIGIPGYLLAACLKLVIAQRLVRRLCVHCKQPSSAQMRYPPHIWPSLLRTWQATGCEHCCSGYYGRTGIYEMLVVTPEIRNALDAGASSSQLAEIAMKQGQRKLFSAGLALAEQGITSVEEVNRVTGMNTETGSLE